jgi:transcriptional regulator with XRE-family HTH domain
MCAIHPTCREVERARVPEDVTADVSENYAKMLGDRVTSLRKKRGLSQKQLATKAGVSSSTISRLEKGEGIPGNDSIRQIARVLEVEDVTLLHLGGRALDPDSFEVLALKRLDRLAAEQRAAFKRLEDKLAELGGA